MRQAAIIFVLSFLLVALVYRKAPTAFFRAESGLYLCASHSDEATQRAA